MKHLKKFESVEDISERDVEEIEELFSDFVDNGYKVTSFKDGWALWIKVNTPIISTTLGDVYGSKYKRFITKDIIANKINELEDINKQFYEMFNHSMTRLLSMDYLISHVKIDPLGISTIMLTI